MVKNSPSRLCKIAKKHKNNVNCPTIGKHEKKAKRCATKDSAKYKKISIIIKISKDKQKYFGEISSVAYIADVDK